MTALRIVRTFGRGRVDLVLITTSMRSRMMVKWWLITDDQKSNNPTRSTGTCCAAEVFLILVCQVLESKYSVISL